MNDDALPPRDAPISSRGLLSEYDERLIRIAQLHYDFMIVPEPGEKEDLARAKWENRTNATLLCWDPKSREWLTWAQWIFTRQPR